MPLLGFTLDDLYYINASMAFGARSSCKIFEEFACAVQWIWEKETESKDVSHYLDDFLFIHELLKICKWYMRKLKSICEFIGAPLSSEKCVGPFQQLEFLGLLLNFAKQTLAVSKEKVNKALNLISCFLETLLETDKNKKGKVTVVQIQSLTGLLNFLCRAVPAGRAFTRRLYNLQKKPYLRIKEVQLVSNLNLNTKFDSILQPLKT